MKLIKLARPSLVQFDPDQPLAKTVDSMIAHELISAPVVQNKKIVGILNLASAQKKIHKGAVLVKDAMQTDIIIYKEGMELEDALLENNSWFPAEDAQGNFVGIIMTKTLISYLSNKLVNQSQHSQELFEQASVKQLNLELDTIIESSFDGIAICDHEGRGMRFNQAHARLTGLDASHFIGQHINDLFEKGIFEYESITAKALREGRTITSVQNISPTGKQVLVTSYPIFDNEGKVSRVVSNIQDISELHKLSDLVQLELSIESSMGESATSASKYSYQERQYILPRPLIDTAVSRLGDELSQSKFLATHQTELPELMIEQLRKDKIIVKSPEMLKLFNLAIRTARTDSTVLLLGESGVGKEVLSRVIHNTSTRASSGRFIQINCGAIPETLLESELFGYEAGAFTGANPQGKPGMFELANLGTLLLDEIGDLSANLQVKLLRVLQEQEVYRLGGISPIKLNVRIIAATNCNIWERVQEGVFREDLFYRLYVLPIEVPPLRERKEDILPLTMHFIHLYNEKYGVEKHFDPKAISILESYGWPGNVRELQNVIERLLVVTEEDLVQPMHVLTQLSKFKNKVNSPITVNEILPIQQAKEMLEKELIIMAFNCYPSIRKAAEALGLDHSNVMRKATKYGIKKEYKIYS
ncbi:sigma 54-interacting transcriptional regulator [Desulfosporosinus lacus]|uniref:HTH-type transcriptional regulatory protein TyrR n=1 Tax=Desulfosporosinus lacus DSM 15449 TaxID=1121420 RepID=A0A1M5YWN2_9FIRM|nr:sigma 54-interacting transcriptional regulator [Desulfosporosinus lacus]SHI16477.1 PAS domain S-box-containing protein [Desulfosporosinus lacus DSM 15449]